MHRPSSFSRVVSARKVNTTHLNVPNCMVALELNTSCSEAMTAPLTRRNYCSPTEQRPPKTWPHGVNKMAHSSITSMGYMIRVPHRVHVTLNRTNTGFLSHQGRIHKYCPEIYDDLFMFVRFEVFTPVTMKNGVFWDVTPYGSCKNRRFGGT
jgi:hypothetical protein